MKTFAIRFAVFVLILALNWFALNWMIGPVDDAYITAHFSERLAAGEGITYNPGEKIEGCTTFGLMILLVPFSWIGVSDLVRISQLLGIFSWALVCTLIWARLPKWKGGKPDGRGAFVIAYLSCGIVPMVWAYSGMETSIVAALWLGAGLLHLHEDETGKLPIFSALATVAAGLMRPDGILIAVAVGASTLLPFSLARFKRATIYSVLVLGLFGGYWLWRWSYFGYPLPNTFYAKVGGGSGILFKHGLYYIAKGAIALAMPILALVFSFRFVTNRQTHQRETWLALGVCGIGLAYLLYIGGDFFPFQRFFVPSLPFWALLFARLRSEKPSANPSPDLEPPASSVGHRVWMWAQVVVAIIAINTIGFFTGGQGRQQRDLVMLTDGWVELGQELGRTLPADTAIATIPIGALGYWSDRYILDLLGLVDLHIAHKEITTGAAVIGHEKYDTEYVLSRSPHLIMTWPEIFKFGKGSLLYWNQRNLLSDAQTTMLAALKGNPAYTTMLVPVGEKMTIASVRSDLTTSPPFMHWHKVPKEWEDVLYANAKILRGLRHGKKPVKSKWQKLMGG
jgi:arabinofuranosyltransferase